MSRVEDFIAWQAQRPEAYALVLNSVWWSWESLTVVALFDTEDAARAYEQAERLPEPELAGRIYHSHREGPLRNFNLPRVGGVIAIPHGLECSGLLVNPVSAGGAL